MYLQVPIHNGSRVCRFLPKGVGHICPLYTYELTLFAQLTRWGESGVYGFLEHLNSRAAATLLLDSITTEARQQMIFRQFEGLFPMPVSSHKHDSSYAQQPYTDLVRARHHAVDGVDSFATIPCELSS